MKIKTNERGTAGYLHRLKRNKIILTAVLFAAALIMFFGAYATLKTKANIFSIMAVLTMLPAAKGLVSVIVTFPLYVDSKFIFFADSAEVSVTVTVAELPV